MRERGNRDMMVVATKYTTQYRGYDLGKEKTVNHTGNSRRSLHMSVRDSLKKLQTDWIDILYVHWYDWCTSIEEIMDSLHILVEQGKVLYLGISDSPAWVVSAANYYARAHGKTPFSVYQGRWNIMTRDFEHEIIPMANHFGMALCPFDVMGGGKFQSKKQIEARKQKGEGLRSLLGSEQNELQTKVSEALETVATEHGIESVTAVAIAYVMQKTRYVIPMIGGKFRVAQVIRHWILTSHSAGRKVEHMLDNIQALKIALTDKQMEYLESVVTLEQTFPTNLIGPDPHLTGKAGGFNAASCTIDYQRYGHPIVPSK